MPESITAEPIDAGKGDAPQRLRRVAAAHRGRRHRGRAEEEARPLLVAPADAMAVAELHR